MQAMSSSDASAGSYVHCNSAREDGDDASDERPLKKARFAWQVKGKYHLKQTELAENPPAPRPAEVVLSSEDDVSSDGDSLDNEVAASAEQNLEILGDYLLKQDFNIVAKGVSTVVPDCAASYPRYTPNRHSTEAEDEGASSPVSSIVRTRNTAEDQYLARWQARQMAKGFVDNTINRVLDSWPVSPSLRTPDETQRNALDVADFIDNLPGNNTIENEGILMAISAHGLQHTAASPFGPLPDDAQPQERLEPCDSTRSQSEISAECDAPSWRDLERPCICSHTLRENLASAQVRPLVPFHHRDPTTPYAYLPQSVPANEATAECPIGDAASSESESSRGECNENKATSSSENIFDEHFDFMDAAILFAIQNKGLNSFGTGYG